MYLYSAFNKSINIYFNFTENKIYGEFDSIYST